MRNTYPEFKKVVPADILNSDLIVFAAGDLAIVFFIVGIWIRGDLEDPFVLTFSIVSTLLGVCMMIVSVNVIVCMSLGYSCTDDSIRMHRTRKTYTLELKDAFYVTRVKVSYDVGRGAITLREYLMLSSRPIDIELDPETGDIYYYLALRKKEIAIIPLHDEDIHQILARKGIHDIPEFPESTYYSRTGDGALS